MASRTAWKKKLELEITEFGMELLVSCTQVQGQMPSMTENSQHLDCKLWQISSPESAPAGFSKKGTDQPVSFVSVEVRNINM